MANWALVVRHLANGLWAVCLPSGEAVSYLTNRSDAYEMRRQLRGFGGGV